MNDEVPDRLHAPMSRAALAKEANVSQSTLKSWSERKTEPLRTVTMPGGGSLYNWLHLRDFCLGNPNLTATRQVLQRYRELFVDPSSHPGQPVATVGANLPTTSRPTSVVTALSDGVTLRSALADLKTQVQKQQSVVAAATRLAQDADRAHLALLARVERLELAVTGETEA